MYGSVSSSSISSSVADGAIVVKCKTPALINRDADRGRGDSRVRLGYGASGTIRQLIFLVIPYAFFRRFMRTTMSNGLRRRRSVPSRGTQRVHAAPWGEY